VGRRPSSPSNRARGGHCPRRELGHRLGIGLVIRAVTSSHYPWWIGAAVGAGLAVVITAQALVEGQPYRRTVDERVSELTSRLNSALAEAAEASEELKGELESRAAAIRALDDRKAEYQEIAKLTEEQLEIAASAFEQIAGRRERRSFWVSVVFTLIVATVTTTIGVLVTLATAK
jgi:Skp family chaperone for outer membrane proteins